MCRWFPCKWFCIDYTLPCMCTPCRQTCFSFTQVLLTFLLCSFLPLWIPKCTQYEGWKTKFLNAYYIQVLKNPIFESLSYNEFHAFPRTFVKGRLQAWSKVVDKSHKTHICRAQKSESPTTITCKLHQSVIVGSSFYGAQNHKRSNGEEHWCNPLWRSKFQNFGGTIWNAIETSWWMMGGPHEWSHDGMHVSKPMGWPLVTCDMAVTATWQPPPITIDVYCHPSTYCNGCLSCIWSSSVWTHLTSAIRMQASCAATLAGKHVGSQACLKWILG